MQWCEDEETARDAELLYGKYSLVEFFCNECDEPGTESAYIPTSIAGVSANCAIF